MALPAGQNSVMNSVPPVHMGQASGTFNSMRQLGGVFGVAIAAAVFSANGSYASPQRFADGVAPAVYVAAALAITGAAIGLLIAKHRTPEIAPATPAVPEVLFDAAV